MAGPGIPPAGAHRGDAPRPGRTPGHVARWTAALWVPAAVAVTIAAGLAYGVGQNLLRSSADDPQVQVAEDAAARLSAGAAPRSVVTGQPVDIATSLALAVSVVDEDGAVLASTAQLDGEPATPPPGALAAATDHPNAVTWQPRPGVRMAAVIAHYAGPTGSGSVVAARSLRVVEHRENQLLLLVVLGLLGGLAATGLAAFAGAWIVPSRARPA